jgi:glucosamine-phosphate N-acetyltransferase
MTQTSLFSADLLSPAVAECLPPGYRLRALRRSDYNNGFLDCLRVLTTVGDITEEEFNNQYTWMSQQNGTYFILVVEDTNGGANKVVGTGALLVERKL